MINIAVVDYGLGNINSINRAIEACGAKAILTSDREEIFSADGLVLPGVGAFQYGMGKLIENNLDKVLQDFAQTGKPILGICLGMQLLFESSEEFGFCAGLSLIPGKVLKLEINDTTNEKLPHVSWNEIFSTNAPSWENTILDGIGNNQDMYFVHSYYVKPAIEQSILSMTEYSEFVYCSTVKHGNIYGCQFHPEKSAKFGLKIIKNFINICEKKDD